MIFNDTEEETASYYQRSNLREVKLMKGTMALVAYFVSKGFDVPTSSANVTSISTEVAPLLYVYVLGNKQPLFDKINASTLVFMDAETKAFLISQL